MDIPVRLCCGQRHLRVQCTDGLVMCCICFKRVPQDQLHTLPPDGQKEDVCVKCAHDEEMKP